MGGNIFTHLAERYPFITLCVHANNEYVGIVQNRDDLVTTIYDYGAIQRHDDKLRFIELANVWWWESNRSIPINIFLKQDWEPFRGYLRTFMNKDLQILHGPVCSLQDLARKKSKRKSITLIRRVD